MKKVLMSVVLLTAAVAGLVFAQAPTMDKLKFVPVGAGFRAEAADQMINGAVVIPATFSGKSVTNIGNFKNCPGISSVTIPTSVTAIDNDAFMSNTGITSIVIPMSVATIGSQAFMNCNNLTNVTFQGIANVNNGWGGAFPGDLAAKYKDGGPGTYTRQPGKTVWAKSDGYAPPPPPPQPAQAPPPPPPPGGRRHFTINGIWTRSDGSQITITENGTIITITEGSGRFTRSYSER